MSLAVQQQPITSQWCRQPIFAHYASIALEGETWPFDAEIEACEEEAQ